MAKDFAFSPKYSVFSPSPLEQEDFRGPHEKRELELMEAGKKPVAWVRDTSKFPKDKYVVRKSSVRGTKLVYPSEHEGRANAIERSIKLFHEGKIGRKTYGARLGKALGYPNEAIKKFIEE